MNVEQIKELIGIVEISNITSFEIEESGYRIRIGKEETISNDRNHYSHDPIKYEPDPAAKREIKDRDSAGGEVPDIDPEKRDAQWIPVKSPMLGVFYSSPSPDREAFVKTGDRIKKGDVLCIIEAMKLMNEIIAEKEGEIAEICLENGQIVEYDQTLFRLRPLPENETGTDRNGGFHNE